LLGPERERQQAGMARQQWRRHAVATLGVACAAVVAVAAADGPMRNSTRPGNDGKAYQHVWPVTQTTLVLTVCLLRIGKGFAIYGSVKL
jgi:hypothetical protein